MTQEELNTKILELQIKLSYHLCDDILYPARFGTFKNDDHIVPWVQLVKALWRYKIDPEENNSCLEEEDVCKIIGYLNETIPYPKLPKKQNTEIGYTYSNHVFSFNLKDCNDNCGCVSDYKDIRIILRQGEEVIAMYGIIPSASDPEIKPLIIVSSCTIGFCLSNQDIIDEGLLTMEIQTNSGNSYATVLKNYKLKILKNG